MDYTAIRWVHIGCAAISITLFVLRGGLTWAGVAWREWRWLRVLPHLNDTLLLAAAVTLAVQSHQYPGTHGWLTAKVLALLVYIGVGRLALQPAASPATQRVAFVAALLTVGYIAAAAHTRSTLLGLG